MATTATITLSELLEQRAKAYEAREGNNEEVIRDWLDAIGGLFAQMKAWIAEADPKGILTLEESLTEIKEPNLGRYKAPRLDIRAFGKWIGILPKARKTLGWANPPRSNSPVGATGRVDITDELNRFILYRIPESGGSIWMIEGPEFDRSEVLDKPRFEAALVSYFR